MRRRPLLSYGVLALLLITGAAGCGRSGATGTIWVNPAPTGAANAAPTATPHPSATARAGSAGAPAAGKATPAPELPPGYTVLSQTCTLQAGQQVYVSLSGKTMGKFRFCTQRLRKDDTGGHYLNPYVFVEPFYFQSRRWHPDSRAPLSLTITCQVSRAGEQDHSLTATSPSGNGPGHTASCGRLVPHAATPTTGGDAYTIRFSAHTSGGHFGALASESEVHVPGAGRPKPEQRVTVPG